MTPTLVLASASPRRRELLARAGVAFVVVPAEVDETPRAGETPRAYAERVAADKARAAAAARPQAHVLAADTVVVLDDEILGKAADEGQAADMLRRLSGRTHVVLTATCLLSPGGAVHARAVATEVDVRPLAEEELAAYLDSEEWRGKAGAYAVQGIFAAFVTAIRGSYTNVVGLPLAEVIEDLRAAGAPGPNFADGEAA